MPVMPAAPLTFLTRSFRPARLRVALPGRPLRSRVWLLAGSMALLGVLLHFVVVRDLPAAGAPFAIPWWALAVCFYAAEIKVIQVQFRREAHSYTLSEIPLVLGLFLASPADLVIAYLVGAGLGLMVHRRPPILKLSFNVSLFLLQASVAATVFHLLVTPRGALDPQSWAATLLATLAVNVIGLSAVATAVRLVEGRPDRRRLPQAIRLGMVVGFTNTGLALIAVTMLSFDPHALWLLGIPLVLVVVAFRSYRAYVAERDQGESLALLYEATGILHGSTDLEEAVSALLSSARKRFRAETAELLLFTDERATDGLRTILGPDDSLELMRPWRLDPTTDALRLEAARERSALIVPRPHRGERRAERVAGREVRDAMVAALVGERRLIGVLVIANRLGDVASFRPDELRLFQTLANHAGIALENGQLGRSLQHVSAQKEELQYRAFHDPLTGLANRALFLDRVRHALDRRGREGNVPVVVFVDLDDFKTVNDTFGHAAGDELLRAVGERLTRCIRPSDLAVRLGGDEFAVLVEDGRDLGAVIRIAERVIEAVKHPITVDGLELRTGASVGLAASHAPGDDADALLRNADVAMYTAKTRGKDRFAVFDPSMDAAVTERRALKAELEGAVERGELVLRYQPIADLAHTSGAGLSGVEALVRWHHPSRGLLEPDRFLPLAEESGLIVPIGRWVLEEGCRQVRAWQTAGHRGLGLSVNVSARQVGHPDFAQEVRAILRHTGLPAGSLTLDVSESLMIADRQPVIAALHGLRTEGVRLAIDDFGRGLSSLGQLGRIPVDVLKIAKPFVDALDGSAAGARIAEAIVALGHSLQLSVVAKGIERPDQLVQLRALDCDRGQGFLLARPLEARQLGRLLERPNALAAVMA